MEVALTVLAQYTVHLTILEVFDSVYEKNGSKVGLLRLFDLIILYDMW
jgi:hypothetical protein